MPLSPENMLKSQNKMVNESFVSTKFNYLETTSDITKFHSWQIEKEVKVNAYNSIFKEITECVQYFSQVYCIGHVL
jgi:hypothetical protein